MHAAPRISPLLDFDTRPKFVMDFESARIEVYQKRIVGRFVGFHVEADLDQPLLAAYPNFVMQFGISVKYLDDAEKRPRLKVAKRARQLFPRFFHKGYLKFLDSHDLWSTL